MADMAIASISIRTISAKTGRRPQAPPLEANNDDDADDAPAPITLAASPPAPSTGRIVDKTV